MNQLTDGNETNSTLEDTTLTVVDGATGDLLNNTVNPDGPSTETITKFTWGANIDVAAGTSANITGVGDLLINANGSYTFTPAANYNGAVPEVSYTVTDGADSVVSTLSLSITAVNDVPVALADTNWAQEDTVTVISGNVIAGADHNTPAAPAGTFADVADTDLDADPLTVASVGGVAVATVGGTDFAGTYGTLHMNADGSYTYTLYTHANNAAAYDLVQALDDGDAPLTDTFSYKANDGGIDSSAVNLTISIFGTNDAPTIAITDGAHTVYEAGLSLGSKVGPTTKEVSGTFTLTDTDGLDDLVSVKVNTGTFTMLQLGAATALLPLLVGDTTAGALYITNYDAGTGVVSYKYVLDTAITDVAAVLEQDVFNVSVSDDGVTFSTPAAITITVVDDLPSFINVNDGFDAGTAVDISTPNPAVNITHVGQFADWQYGADGEQGVPTLTGVTGNISVASSTSASVVLDLKDSNGNLAAKVTLNADGTDSIEVVHRDPVLQTDILLTGDVIASGPAVVKTINSTIGGLVVTVTGSDGNATPGEGSDEVNPSTLGWAVGNNIINANESIKFSFNQNVERFSFTADGFTGGGGAAKVVGLIVRVFYTDTIWEDLTVSTTTGQVIQVDGLLDFGMTVDGTTYTSIVAVDVLSDPNVQNANDGFRLNNVTVSKLSSEAPADLDYKFTLNVMDGDGDVASQTFNVHVDGDATGSLVLEAIAGTSGADTLVGTAGNDILIGGQGNDILTGDLGADTFKWQAGDTGLDTVIDFNRGGGAAYNPAEGDVLNLADLLQGETAVAANLTSFLNFSLSGSDTVIKVDADGGGVFGAPDQTIVLQDVDLVTGAIDQSAIIQSLLTGGNLVTDA